MITIVLAAYAVIMLTIVLAVFAAAAKPQPQRTAALEEMPVRRSAPPVFKPTVPNSVQGGTEVLAFEA